MPAKLQVRIPDDLDSAIAERERSTRDRPSTVREILGRYLEVCRRELPVLDVEEWHVVMDALNGSWYEGPQQADWWRVDVADLVTQQGGARRHGVRDADRFLGKIRDLSYSQCVAVLDLAERYWAAVQRGEEPTVPGETAAEG